MLVGPNGAGKTNVVEAIGLLTRGESFRTSTWSDLVRWGAESASATLVAQDGTSRTEICLEVVGGRRSYHVNGSAKRRIGDVAGAVPAVVFTPDDLRMVKDAADRRRAALDSLGGQLSRTHAATRAEYDRIVRQRNVLLRKPDTPEREIEPWTERLIETGSVLRAYRTRLLGWIADETARIYSSLTDGEEIMLVYLDKDRASTREPTYASGPSNDIDSAAASIAVEMRAARERRAREERARGASLFGPHRDDVAFLLDGRDARAFASQGQQRTISLAWKLAEVDTIERVARSTPVLLLDDVMSELDEMRRHKLAVYVKERTQTFITTTNLGYFDEGLVTAAKVVELS